MKSIKSVLNIPSSHLFFTHSIFFSSRLASLSFRCFTKPLHHQATVVIAEGSEEIESVVTIDVLRRGGMSSYIDCFQHVVDELLYAGLNGCDPVRCSRDVVIVPDTVLSNVAGQDSDAVILPGGLKGAESFASIQMIGDILKRQEKAERMIAAICAAPIALKAHGVCTGKRVTSHPSKAVEMMSDNYDYSEDRVVSDGQLVTSRGPGTAFEFALCLVEKLVGSAKVISVHRCSLGIDSSATTDSFILWSDETTTTFKST